jgi:hypothetical protein
VDDEPVVVPDGDPVAEALARGDRRTASTSC